VNVNPFHLAIRVADLEASRAFYGELLGCPEGRSADTWVDFNFYGHQLVCHLAPCDDAPLHTNGDLYLDPYSGLDISAQVSVGGDLYRDGRCCSIDAVNDLQQITVVVVLVTLNKTTLIARGGIRQVFQAAVFVIITA